MQALSQKEFQEGWARWSVGTLSFTFPLDPVALRAVESNSHKVGAWLRVAGEFFF
jgi:hypothetical protein